MLTNILLVLLTLLDQLSLFLLDQFYLNNHVTEDDLSLEADKLEQLDRAILQFESILAGIERHFIEVTRDHLTMVTNRQDLVAKLSAYLALHEVPE